MEIFKTIPGYENYQASNLGNIKSIKFGKERILKPSLTRGYPGVVIDKKRKPVHRLVLLAFVGDSKLHCNHKNGVRNDNRIENLEYMTASDNLKHKYRSNGYKNHFQTDHPMKGKFGKNHVASIPVIQLERNGKFIKKWDSLSQASKKLNIDCGHISKCCKGKMKTIGGYKWEYFNKE